MLIIKSDFEGAYKDISLLENEKSDCDSLKSALEAFINDTNNTGPAYVSIRKYFSGYCLPVIQKRIDAADELIQKCTSACNNFNSYVGEDYELDDSMIDDLKSKLSTLNIQISSLDYRIGDALTEKEAKSIAVSRADLRSAYQETEKMLRKLEQLKPNNDSATATIESINGTVTAYLSAVNQYSGLSGILGNYTYDPAADEKGVDITDDAVNVDTENVDPPVEDTVVPLVNNPDGGGGGPAPLVDTDTSIDDPEITSTDPTSTSLTSLAVSLVGLTAEELAKDKNNGIFNEDNYKADEEWNAKFVNDLLNRNPNTKELLKDYYTDEETYDKPYNNLESLLKYSQAENTNMNFNWSDSSLDTIVDKTGTIVSKSYTPKEGDVVFFDTENSFNGETANPNRAGIIESVTTTTDANGVTKTTITVLEGDTKSSDGTGVVSRVTYDLSSEDILGYGSLKTENTPTENV